MRAIAQGVGAYAEQLEGSWSVEIGPCGPRLAMICSSKRREGTVRRIRKQLVHTEPCKGRYSRMQPYIFGDSVPFGPWEVETSEFRRYGRDD